MYITLFDDRWEHFRPLTTTRPVADLRFGILTIAEKWQLLLPNTHIQYSSQPYLQPKFPNSHKAHLHINARISPSTQLLHEIQNLPPDSALWHLDTLVACRLPFPRILANEEPFLFAKFAPNQFKTDSNPLLLTNIWDLFTLNAQAIKADFQLLTHHRQSQPLPPSNTLIGPPENLFIEAGASIQAAILNTTDGPIYIGAHAEVMEGSIIRGPFALCEHAATKLGTKIYGPTTIGPYSKVGGEVSNSILWGYSNKGHEGFLGNSLLGQWCNLGADTNNSNLKNNYSPVDIWNYPQQSYINTQLQFCGLIMGDHSKCGINTMFNTGTVVGVSANIYGADFPPKFIPDFAWGSPHDGFVPYQLDKALATAQRVLARRQLELSTPDIEILSHIYQQAHPSPH